MINKQKNNLHARIARERINEKNSLVEMAVKWCQVLNVHVEL